MDSQEEEKYRRRTSRYELRGKSDRPTVIIRKNGLTSSRLVMLAVCLMVVMVISGCGVNGTVNAQTPGLFNHYLVYPFFWLIGNFAGWLDGSYGLALIAITILVRTVLLPFMLLQYKSQHAMRMKMNSMQPEIEAIKTKYEEARMPTRGLSSSRKQWHYTASMDIVRCQSDACPC